MTRERNKKHKKTPEPISHLRKSRKQIRKNTLQRAQELFQLNNELDYEVSERVKIEKYIRISNSLLELLGRISLRKEYLDSVARLIQGVSALPYVGIRLLDEDGNIPYESYIGFSRKFWETENRLSICRDQCACIRVINEKPLPQDIPVMTDAGSFYCGNMIEYTQKLSEQEKCSFRGVCVKNGFSTVAIIPIRYKNKIIGLIHLADEKEESICVNTVKLIESLTPLIGEGIYKFNLAEQIQHDRDIQRTINSLLLLSLNEINLEEFLKQALQIIVSVSWFSLELKGSIYLREENKDVLVLKAQGGLPAEFGKQCSRLNFGDCFCGRAAQTKEIQFSDKHLERKCADMPIHGHYCVPILLANKVLGVINIYIKEGAFRDKKKEEFLASIANVLAEIIHRKQIENNLSGSSELLNRIFSNTNLLIAYMDRDFNFIHVNQAYAASDGKTPDFFVGKNHFELYPSEENKAIFRKVADTADIYSAYAKPFVYPEHPEKGITYWDWTLQPIKDVYGRVEGLILILVDVTKKNKTEEELIKAQKKLLETKRLSDIGILAATVAHELRNPLGVIRIAAYNLKRKSQNPLLETHFTNIEKKIQESDQIITNLLFYSRIKMPQYEKISLYALLEECVNLATNKFRKLKVKIVKRYRCLKNNLLETDPLQMREVFCNILNNAFEAGLEENGKIEIEAGFDRIKHEVNITIKDNGLGISPDDLKKISEPFFTTKSKGTGLGLAVSYQIINLHGGRIDVKSKKGEGTSFTVTLPANTAREINSYEKTSSYC